MSEEKKSTEEILTERGKDYGDFGRQAFFQAQLKLTLKLALSEQATRTGRVPNAAEEAAMEMICVKLSRLAYGNIHHLDSWQDISGYAELVVNLLKGPAQGELL